MSTKPPSGAAGKAERETARDSSVAIAAARYNQEIVDALLKGCLRRLAKLGVRKDQIDVYRVPGAFELPLAAQALARTKCYDAVICLGAVVRGETPHFEYVAGRCAAGVAAVGLKEDLPVIFGVLTTNNEEQAWDRCGGKHGHAGERAADAAIEMIALLKHIDREASVPF